ncbi:MAG TPA: hypothetical protein VMV92_04165 [Streptosporangiaceae bacterium]|nr:hypothetical protein [Streptosporangiaceae bacterium]
MRKFRIMAAALGALGALGLSTGPALASTGPALNISFFTGGSGSAHWLPQHAAIQIAVPDTSSYAGADLHHILSSLPDDPPSFSFTETGTASGGAPRLVIASANGCYAVEYALTPYSDTMTATQWDLMGTCGFQYNAGWAGVQAAFTGTTVQDAYVVSDSYTDGHTDTITSLEYNDQNYLTP